MTDERKTADNKQFSFFSAVFPFIALYKAGTVHFAGKYYSIITINLRFGTNSIKLLMDGRLSFRCSLQFDGCVLLRQRRNLFVVDGKENIPLAPAGQPVCE